MFLNAVAPVSPLVVHSPFCSEIMLSFVRRESRIWTKPAYRICLPTLIRYSLPWWDAEFSSKDILCSPLPTTTPWPQDFHCLPNITEELTTPTMKRHTPWEAVSLTEPRSSAAGKRAEAGQEDHNWKHIPGTTQGSKIVWFKHHWWRCKWHPILTPHPYDQLFPLCPISILPGGRFICKSFNKTCIVRENTRQQHAYLSAPKCH